MAKATRQDIEVKPVEKPYKIILELSKEESEALLMVTRLISGSMSNSSRRYFDSIQNTLEECNVSWRKYAFSNLESDTTKIKGYIEFSDTI